MDQNWTVLLKYIFLMLHCLKCTAYQNSELNYMVTGDLITVYCRYTGNGSVNGVSLYNGSTDVPLTILAESCKPLSLNKSSFDASRIQNYTCNGDYTLSFKLVPSIDYNVTMGCTFLDPDAGEPKSYIRILDKGSSSDGVGGVGGWSTLTIVLITGLGLVLLAVAVIAYFCWRWKTGSGKKELPATAGKYSYHRTNGEADQESLREEIGDFENLHKK